MTTIALRDGILAVDTLLWSDGRPYGYGRKLGRSKDGWWLAGAGDAHVTMGALEWAKNRMIGRIKTPWKGLPEDWTKSGMLMLSPEGESYFFEGFAPVRFSADFTAEGVGAGIAIGAMDRGATAIEAVHAAMRYVPSTGGQVHWVRAGDLEVNITPGVELKR